LWDVSLGAQSDIDCPRMFLFALWSNFHFEALAISHSMPIGNNGGGNLMRFSLMHFDNHLKIWLSDPDAIEIQQL
jgi:hypothetical protein